jgi:PAS domain S-box-containing protein
MGAPDGRLVLFNEAFERLTGYSGAELRERALTWSADLTPPEWRATEAEILARAVSERHPVSYEKEYLRKDGSRVPIELLVQPIFDEDGTLLHYRSFLTDISARKQAEQRLLDRETEAARLDEGLPGNRTTRLVDRFRGHRWRVLLGAIAIQSAILLALNSAHSPRHVLGLPGSMIALFSVLAGALAGPLAGALVAVAGGGVFYLTVGGRGSQSTVLTTVISTAVWVTAGLLSGFLAKTLTEQVERRRAAAVALVRADAAREAQLAEQARVEELAQRLQLQTEELQAAGEELSAQRDELHETALENARLYEREAAAARLAEVLNEMNALINSTLDSREIMQTVVEHAVAAVRADSAMVALRHGDDWVAEYGYPEVPGVLHETVRTDEAPFMVTAVTERRPIAIDDCETDPRCIPEVQRRFGVRSVLCMPLIVREEVLGVIFFNHHEAAVAFPPAIVEFAAKLAASISTALANARLYEEQQRIATTLQENLLHELPTVAGLELGVVTKTAFEPELVGGDFSDVFVVDDTHVVLMIGDVAGKGVRAAGLTETVRSTVRALAAVDPSPAFILGKTNELLLGYDPDEAHVTAFLAALDPHTGHLSYASAGHPAPVRLGAYTCDPLAVVYGPPLGTFSHPYKESHAMLTLEDYLVLYTDGVTEARRDGELLGERRLLEIVEGLRGCSAQEVTDGVRDAASEFADGRLRDDMQVVVLRLA